MQFVRPTLHPRVRPCADVERMRDGEYAVVAGWPVARQHPKGRDGTIFVTIEDEIGDAQAILCPHVYARYRRELGSQVVIISGEISRYYGTAQPDGVRSARAALTCQDAEVARLAVMKRSHHDIPQRLSLGMHEP